MTAERLAALARKLDWIARYGSVPTSFDGHPITRAEWRRDAADLRAASLFLQQEPNDA